MARAYLASPIVSAEQGQVRLAPHQADAASRVLTLLGQWGGAVLADATGLGKTFTAIAVARLHAPVMVVTPAALRAMWCESLGRTGLSAHIASYEALSRGHAIDRRPALLILDEAHHARNPGTRRYAQLADLAWGARVLALTATPIHNRSRDLRALLALFLGSRADGITEEELLQVIVRRTPEEATGGAGPALPSVSAPHWLTVPADPETLQAIVALPEAARTADGGSAHALMILGLIRAWSSSEAALRETLRRRLRRAASLGAALDSGRIPSRRELASWPVVDDAIQLGFAGLFGAPDEARIDAGRVRAALDEHVEGVRAILRCLDRNEGAADRERVRAVRSIVRRKPLVPLVAFTQFADSALAMFRHCVPDGGVALVTGRGARVASGHVTVEEIVRGFDLAPDDKARTPAMPLRILIASDVLSEGLSLRRAGVLVHLDLPWTIARLEQRVGRLRRIGSRHSIIDVYAVGPPVSARELVPVVRALQRKARLSSAIVGMSELTSSIPLLGQRLVRATAALRGEGTGGVERLRLVLSRWLVDMVPRPAQLATRMGRQATLVLIAHGGAHRLLAVKDSDLTENLHDVLIASELLSATPATRAPIASREATCSAVDQWIAEQRGRDLARLATSRPSAAHAAILRVLQDRLRSASRFERKALGARIETCRRMILATRGIGAERALLQLSQLGVDLDALETLLESRTVADVPTEPPRLVAVLSVGDPQIGVEAWMAEEIDR